jgi:hypothetical protein
MIYETNSQAENLVQSGFIPLENILKSDVNLSAPF